jgi:hypothetical protein
MHVATVMTPHAEITTTATELIPDVVPGADFVSTWAGPADARRAGSYSALSLAIANGTFARFA